MASHNDTGRRGELLAACWLTMNGFQILFKNWRYGRGEIDIIARKQGVLHFIEVKTSRSVAFGYPEERINRRKLKSMFRCSSAFLRGWPGEPMVQFDILSVLIRGKTVQYHFVKDAFLGLSAFNTY